jgi:hypothetical protein
MASEAKAEGETKATAHKEHVTAAKKHRRAAKAAADTTKK